MSNKDALELHNALVGAKEQLDYITWLCEQLGYIEPPQEGEIDSA